MEPYGYGIREWRLGSDAAHMEGGGRERRGGVSHQADATVSSPFDPNKMNILLTLVLNRVLSCIYTSDARFVLSGSDDGNVRMWKAKPNDRLGVLGGRERNALEYREALKERWKFDKEISRIQRYVIVYL